MRQFILIIGLLSSGVGISQIQSEFEMETASGYMHNIFRSPSSFIDEDELFGKDDLIRSSIYQDMGFKGIFKKFWKNENISLRLYPKGRLFLSDTEATFYTVYSRFRYEKNFSRKTRLWLTSHWNLRDREGENLDDNELRTPLGYRHLDISAGLFFRLYDQHRGFINLEIGNRNYQDAESNDLQYDYYTINTVFRNVFERPEGWHSYGIEAQLSKRLYERTYFEPEVPKETRDWSYIVLEPFYRWPVSKNWRLRGGVEWSKRKDNNKGTFTYRQIRPSLELRYKNEKWLIETEGSYTIRDFDGLNATNSAEEILGKLNFKYYRLKVDIEYELGRKLYLTANMYVNNRNSNRTNINTITFRSYDYYYAGIGLRFEF